VTLPPDSPDRFNEEKATYSLRGTGAPDLEAGVAAIRAVVKSLPARPGVYRMLDARGDVLYVGKARALKNRVTQYTQVARQTKRLLRMIAQTRSMQIVTTSSEA
jgi:excinuclease ABC subunit C